MAARQACCVGPTTNRELQGGSQSLGHPAQGPEEESVGGADRGGPPRSSLMGRTCGHMQAQEHRGLFPGAPGQGSYLLSEQEAGPQQELCCPATAPSAPGSWPRGDSNPALPPPSSVQPSGLKSRPQLSSGPSERVRAGSSFRLSSTAPLLSEPQAPHIPGSWGLAKPPKLSPGPQAFPLPNAALDSYRRPTHPVSSQHWQLRAGRGGGHKKVPPRPSNHTRHPPTDQDGLGRPAPHTGERPACPARTDSRSN